MAKQQAAKAGPDPTTGGQNATQNAEKQPENGGNVQTQAEDLPGAVDTVKVKFLRSHPALAYAPGEVADLPRPLYDRYLEDGPFYEAVVESATVTE